MLTTNYHLPAIHCDKN
uniref:Uncharacterized protein n=1 Tax=Arundo donax TaxID=35708 RepID=A0A0A8Z2Y2_ARUDO